MPTGTKVRDWTGKRVEGDKVGLEFEIRYDGNLNPTGKTWRFEADGSLRGKSTEAVLRVPTDIKDLQAPVRELSGMFSKKAGVQTIDAPQCGVHIHVNVNDILERDLWTNIMIYYTLETLLVSNAGKGRMGNFFCLRLSEASAIRDNLEAAVAKKSTAHLASRDRNRYAALNFDALANYGSLEWRALRTPMDFARALPWAQALVNVLRGKTHNYKTPADVVEDISRIGAMAYARRILGDQFALVQNTPDIAGTVQEDLWEVQEICYLNQWD